MRQRQKLVPREVELSQGGQEQSEVFEIIVAQIQHLNTMKYGVKVFYQYMYLPLWWHTVLWPYLQSYG